MKVKFGKLFGWIVLDIFMVGVVKEVIFNEEDFNLPSVLLDAITYNSTHFFLFRIDCCSAMDWFFNLVIFTGS